MPLSVLNFIKHNVTDTCAVWNILSSDKLLKSAKSAECIFCCTAYVQYECLDKPRNKQISQEEEELRSLLRSEQSKGNFSSYHLDIDDLLDVEVLRKRMDIGKGELSSIAFARRTRQAFLTDDQGARTLAAKTMGASSVQTTPQLFGWLIYEHHLTDSDKGTVIEQHTDFGRPLKKYFETMYKEALQNRLMETHG